MHTSNSAVQLCPNFIGNFIGFLGLMIAVPPWLITVTQRIAKETTLFPAPINHVLVNEYLPGQGIMVCTLPLWQILLSVHILHQML
jgi:hypothetical protein